MPPPPAGHGFKAGVVLGIVGIVLGSLASEGVLPRFYVTLINIVSISAFILAIGKVKYWNYSYFGGYVLAQIFLMESGFYTTGEIALYTFLTIIMIIMKFSGILNL